MSIGRKVEIVKGCRDYGMNKGECAFVAVESGKLGISVVGLGHTMYMAGNRKKVPAMTVGSRYNLHKGDPTRYITVEVVSI